MDVFLFGRGGKTITGCQLSTFNRNGTDDVLGPVPVRVEMRHRRDAEGRVEVEQGPEGDGALPELVELEIRYITARQRHVDKLSEAKPNLNIEFEARGPLPTLLKGTPEPVLRTAAKAVSEALASAATDRFAKQVPDAYATWAKGAAATA